MFRISTLTMMLLLFISMVAADVTAGDLSGPASERLRANERHLVRAGVPKEDAAHLTRLMMENRFQERHAIRVQNLVLEAIEKDLPYEPVMNKAFEGIAKKIAPETIARAMEKTRSRYAQSYTLAFQFIQNKTKAKAIGNTLAQGLTAGMQIEDLNRVMVNIRNATRKMTMSQSEEMALQTVTTIRTMARLGVPSQTAADVACRALEKEYSIRDMAQLRHTFTEQAKHKSSQELASRYSQAIQAGARPDNLSAGGALGGHGVESPNGHHGGEPGGGSPGGGSDGSGGGGSSGGSGGSGGGSDGSGGGGSSGGSGGSGGGSDGSGGGGSGGGSGGSGGGGSAGK